MKSVCSATTSRSSISFTCSRRLPGCFGREIGGAGHPLPAPDAGQGSTEAPHLDVTVFARGLLDRLVTRLYFPDEPAANEADPVLVSIGDAGRRDTLIARAEPAELAEPAEPGDLTRPGTVLRFDIRLQGAGETVFFDV